MNEARALWNAPRDELRARLLEGGPIDPRALQGWAFRGTAIGLPDVVARLSWKTFQKTFWKDQATGRLLGWNVRLEQDGLDAPSRPKLVRGKPWCTWFYEVIEPRGVPFPEGFDRGLIIDYSRGPNPAWDSIRWVKDPLVALEPGNDDHLLGVSYAVVGGLCVETPTWFTLERESRIEFVPPEVTR